MQLHAFVAMPYGTKDGIDFNAVYSELIRPGLQQAGLDVFRADQETRAGDIREDMFQELLLADLVVADLSIDDANVWYELGVRHGLRARGVVLIQRSDRPTQPFDVYTDRKLNYHLKEGKPDPAHLEADREALAEMARATLDSWRGRKISPSYALIDHLREPDWRSLLFSTDNEFKAAFAVWWRRVELARKSQRPGDIMLLAEEAPAYAVELDARRAAGNSLLRAASVRARPRAVRSRARARLDRRGEPPEKGRLPGAAGSVRRSARVDSERARGPAPGPRVLGVAGKSGEETRGPPAGGPKGSLRRS